MTHCCLSSLSSPATSAPCRKSGRVANFTTKAKIPGFLPEHVAEAVCESLHDLHGWERAGEGGCDDLVASKKLENTEIHLNMLASLCVFACPLLFVCHVVS